MLIHYLKLGPSVDDHDEGVIVVADAACGNLIHLDQGATSVAFGELVAATLHGKSELCPACRVVWANETPNVKIRTQDDIKTVRYTFGPFAKAIVLGSASRLSDERTIDSSVVMRPQQLVSSAPCPDFAFLRKLVIDGKDLVAGLRVDMFYIDQFARRIRSGEGIFGQGFPTLGSTSPVVTEVEYTGLVPKHVPHPFAEGEFLDLIDGNPFTIVLSIIGPGASSQ